MTLNQVLERIPSSQWTLYRAWIDKKHQAMVDASKRR